MKLKISVTLFAIVGAIVMSSDADCLEEYIIGRGGNPWPTSSIEMSGIDTSASSIQPHQITVDADEGKANIVGIVTVAY